jgi:protein-arginine kinase activator protein McsA
MDKCPISGNNCPYLKTISIVDIENGKAFNQVKVCHSCIGDCMGKELPIKEKKEDILNEDILNIEDMPALIEDIKKVSKLISDSKTLEPLEAKEVPNKVCPNCGISLKEISKEGRLGCNLCYDCFEDELTTVIHHAQKGGSRHVGKVPKKWKKKSFMKQTENELELEILESEIELDAAILKEDYESAASFRDKIKELRSNLNENLSDRL